MSCRSQPGGHLQRDPDDFGAREALAHVHRHRRSQSQRPSRGLNLRREAPHLADHRRIQPTLAQPLSYTADITRREALNHPADRRVRQESPQCLAGASYLMREQRNPQLLGQLTSKGPRA